MKKILAILLALMMVLVSVAALAEQVDPNTADTKTMYQIAPVDTDTISLTKTYTVSGDNAVNPTDTLTFTYTKVKVENATAGTTIPDITIADVAVSGTSATINVKLPKYSAVGEYYYAIKETDTGVAGVTYLADTIYMKVQVFQTETGLDRYVTFRLGAADSKEKIDTITNTYEAGTLTVSKKVDGNMGDVNKVWNFTVVFTAPSGDKVVGDISTSSVGATAPAAITAGESGWTTTKTATFTLKDGQSVTFSNIPKGVTYVIKETEANADGYKTTVGGAEYTNADGFSGNIAGSENDTAAFTNKKDVEIDTGVALDFVPYVLIMALALIGFVVLKIRRREDY